MDVTATRNRRPQLSQADYAMTIIALRALAKVNVDNMSKPGTTAEDRHALATERDRCHQLADKLEGKR